MTWSDHLVIAPILLPLLAGILILLADDRHPRIRLAISVGASLLLLGLAVLLALQADRNSMTVYLLGNWPPPFAIMLVADRLAALMVLLTSILGVAALIFSIARWHRAGTHFHPLFQFLLMGLNGAFLTGDLFNLFVFFEVMLAASYGLVLYAPEPNRVRAGMHYVVVNLAASLLFLLGASLIYSATGTLNIAHLAALAPALDTGQRMLFEAGIAVLAVVFLVKAGIWPLCFWLPTTYANAAAPVAAVLAIASKVGIYVILRLWLLLFGDEGASSAGFGVQWLWLAGVATILFGAICVLASQDLGRLAGYSVLVSSGTVLVAIISGGAPAIGAGLFYLVSSTLGIAAFWLLVELTQRGRSAVADLLAVTQEAFGQAQEPDLDDEPVGIPIPATMAMLGIAFAGCALLLAGLPPLSGFVGKFAILAALLAGDGASEGVAVTAWVVLGVLLFSGMTALIGLTRAGMRLFWPAVPRTVPDVRLTEMAPVALLLGLCLALTVEAGGVMGYMQRTAEALVDSSSYRTEVLTAPVREAGR